MAIAMERWTDEKLDQLAETNHTLSTTQLQITKAMEALVEKIVALQQQQEAIVQAKQVLTETQHQIAKSIAQIIKSIERLTDHQEQQVDYASSITKNLVPLAENLASTNAAVERLDRLMDYLIERDGKRINDDRSDN
jgi:uncharacterized coiled-coil protein SlyX